MDIAVASRPKPCETECGDQCAIIENGGDMLIVVADGLGHGCEAAKAAKAACDFVRANAGDELDHMIIACSKAITNTRGVAMSLLRIQPTNHQMVYVGVGNVEMRSLTQQAITPVNTPGIVGRRIVRVKTMNYRLHTGDLLLMYTDGISERVNLKPYVNLDVQVIADRILADFAKQQDDATCAVIRYK